MEFLRRKNPARPPVTPEMCAEHPDVVMPIVRRHPTTGQNSVYVNAKNTRRVVPRAARGGEAMTDAEGVALVRELTEKVIAAGSYAHKWRRGDLVVFDNRVLLHAASPFDSERYERLLMRAEFEGEAVVPAASLKADDAQANSCSDRILNATSIYQGSSVTTFATVKDQASCCALCHGDYSDECVGWEYIGK